MRARRGPSASVQARQETGSVERAHGALVAMSSERDTSEADMPRTLVRGTWENERQSWSASPRSALAQRIVSTSHRTGVPYNAGSGVGWWSGKDTATSCWSAKAPSSDDRCRSLARDRGAAGGGRIDVDARSPWLRAWRERPSLPRTFRMRSRGRFGASGLPHSGLAHRIPEASSRWVGPPPSRSDVFASMSSQK